MGTGRGSGMTAGGAPGTLTGGNGGNGGDGQNNAAGGAGYGNGVYP